MPRFLSVPNGITNYFATFLLLLYTKLLHQSVLLLHCPIVYSLNNGQIRKDYVPTYDPTSKTCANIVNYLLVLLIYVFFNILPILILILYPFQFLKTCLLKCKMNVLVLSEFVEKFHSCYKDGSNDGMDMRNLSSLYFVLRHLIFLCRFLFNEISYWYYQGYLFMAMAILIGYLKPYKETYMNTFDTFLLMYMSVCCHMLSRIYFGLEEDQFIDMIIIFYRYLDFWLFIKRSRSSTWSSEVNGLVILITPAPLDDPTEPLLTNMQ